MTPTQSALLGAERWVCAKAGKCFYFQTRSALQNASHANGSLPEGGLNRRLQRTWRPPVLRAVLFQGRVPRPPSACCQPVAPPWDGPSRRCRREQFSGQGSWQKGGPTRLATTGISGATRPGWQGKAELSRLPETEALPVPSTPHMYPPNYLFEIIVGTELK